MFEASSPAEGASIEGVASVEVLAGPEADLSRPIELLVEVPHGADERAHYDALASRLKSPLPENLHYFFHTNTDIGAWDYGKRVARAVLSERPRARAMIIRCLVPRTFVDTNRELTAEDELKAGGLTGAIAPYVTDPSDLSLLHSLHARYVALVDEAYHQVCGAGGIALTPHTYGPYVLPIAKIDAAIVENLIAAHSPEMLPSLKVRPEIDLLTDTKEEERLADPALTDWVSEGLRQAGFSVALNEAYRLVPGSQTYRLSRRFPQQVFCLEVRRDLLVEEYTPFFSMRVDPERSARVARPIASAISRWLAR